MWFDQLRQQLATSATREARRGQTALRLFGFFRPEPPSLRLIIEPAKAGLFYVWSLEAG